ncbi:tagaturonate reductase, partial [Intestinibacillus massiliensis]|nr:tagaturonate reductase [Intestinibacillus massiliensis]
KLTYETLDILNYDGYLLRQAPEKVIQFGEGNFLRGFVDYFIDLANERGGFNGKVAVVQPIPAGRIGDINRQEGLYTLCLRGRDRQGIRNEKRIISCISRGIDPYEDFASFLDLARNEEMEYIVSNTT